MSLFFILVFCFNFVVVIKCSQMFTLGRPVSLNITAYPPSNIVTWASDTLIIVKNEEDPLNLTCSVPTLPIYKVTWRFNSTSNQSRPLKTHHNSLIFPSLQRSEAGEYTCSYPGLGLQQNIRIRLTYKKGPRCHDRMFRCLNGNCLNKHYVCDGKADCSDMFDEHQQICGSDPCLGKLRCEDDRCIPLSWCCDRRTNENCTVNNTPKCCLQLTKHYYDDEIYGYTEHSNEQQQKLNDMGFLQTTIYTVIGCAMAFMFVTTVLVVAICRIHTKRSLVSQCRQPIQSHSGLPMYSLDLFTQDSGLQVTYNINNGVQFVGRPVDPPPYCEVVDRPPREGPPPPYVSRENVSQIIPLQANAADNNALVIGGNNAGDSNIEELSRSNVLGDRLGNALEDDCTKQKSSAAKSRSDTNISDRLLRNSDAFSSLKDVAMDENVNIYVNKLCSNKGKDESDDEVSYTENDSLLAQTDNTKVASGGAGGGSRTRLRSSAGGSCEIRRPASLILTKGIRRSKAGGGAGGSARSSVERHSLGDMSPSSESFSFDGEVVTLPLRESFIGVRESTDSK